MKTIAILALLATATTIYLVSNPIDFRDANDIEFDQFVSMYGKNYVSENEVAFRKQVFKANMETARILDARNPLADFGMTIFSDQTEGEMVARMGAIAPSKQYDAEMHEGVAEPNEDLDWRPEMNEVQNQGSCGSCWAFSATATFETRAKLVGKIPLTKLSEQEVVDCTSSQYGCNGGWMHDAFDYLHKTAFCTEASYGYKAVKGTCHDTDCDATIKDASTVMVAGTEDALMSALHDGPVSIALDASTWSFYKGGVMTDCGTGMNHAVVLSGFETDNNAWIVRNSWGSGWGEAGYVRLAYGKNTCNLTYKSSYPTF